MVLQDAEGWKPPLDGVELWLEPGAGSGMRLLLAIPRPAEPFAMELCSADGRALGWIVFKPYAVLRNRSVLEAAEVRLADCPGPNLPDAWSGALGLQLAIRGDGQL